MGFNMQSLSAEDLYEKALVWDMVWPWEPWAGNDLRDLARLARNGYACVSITVAGDNHDIGEAIERVAFVRRSLCAFPEFMLIESVRDITVARSLNKLAVSMHFEGTRCFGRNLDVIETFYKLGVRHTLLAFNSSNSSGGGCAEEADGGLTRFGRRVIAEMSRVGMLLDLSHTGYRTTMDAMEVSDRPVMFSHSNVAALCPSFRNLRDDQIAACVETGGVVGISGSSSYLGDMDCRIETVFKHIDYIVQRHGPDHAALGLDLVFNHESVTAWARDRPDEWPMVKDSNWPGFRYVQPESVHELVGVMLAHGYDEMSIRKILGENHVRVCEQVWK